MTTNRDLTRQISVLVLAVVAIFGAAWGAGAFGGTPTSEAADGALSASATPVAPGTTAFSIWSVIYLGLVAYAVWQALPAQRESARQRSMGWLAALSILLNAGWLLVVQAGSVWASVVVMAALLTTLVMILERMRATTSSSLVETVLVDGTFGLYLGWVTVAAIANVTAALKTAEPGDLGLGATGWPVVLLVVAALIAVGFAVHTGGRLTINLAMAWGLAWIAAARWEGPLEDSTVAPVAAAAAAVALLSAVVVRLRQRA
ncbi:tryptophan-rich sensory protein [Sanguibacter sp. 4.1]|uniref:Tryptophan-rich sensory protein n=1 Tax=Sanguibacter biliveldensis TaxID=3030830 RepID=A0AAF0Z690_9MICO|nr:TspO/MBR family protein [Sanguibacter sp. 4.1]WPF82854.1 tryptophan-rich sensory protein [Sanguibacter sp. 4.1]